MPRLSRTPIKNPIFVCLWLALMATSTFAHASSSRDSTSLRKHSLPDTLDDGTTKAVYHILESILASHTGVKLAFEPSSKSLILVADAPVHQLVEKLLDDFSRKFSENSRSMNSLDNTRKYAIHIFQDTLILLNSETGDTWVLSKAKDARTPFWTQLNREE